MLLQKTAKKALIEDVWTINPSISFINQQIAVSLETTADSVFGLVGTTKIYLQQNEVLPFKWSGIYWPSKAGWHTISSTNKGLHNWYVFNRTHWQSVVASQKINATKLYALKHPITNKTPISLSQTITTIIPKIVFFLFFLLAAGFLWLERKL